MPHTAIWGALDEFTRLLLSTAGISPAQLSLLMVLIWAVLLAVAFGLFQLSTIVADARLQHSITGDARATVTSTAGMSTDAVNVVIYGSYAALAVPGGHSGAFTFLAIPYLVLTFALKARR